MDVMILITGKEISVPKSRYPEVKRQYTLFKGRGDYRENYYKAQRTDQAACTMKEGFCSFSQTESMLCCKIADWVVQAVNGRIYEYEFLLCETGKQPGILWDG